MVKSKILKNKPLVEAIFEIKWELTELAPGVKLDPHYKVLIGIIYDRIKKEYPYHEPLPTSTIPDEISGYIVQHRFRKEKDKWPLIQLGPGIITLNDTEGYSWEDFYNRINQLLNVIYEVYSDINNGFRINGLLLRYIDAVNFDYEDRDILKFLEENLKISVKIHESLFKETGVNDLPLNIDLKFSFSSTKPKGVIHLRFARGRGKNYNKLMWETMVQSNDKEIPNNKNEIIKWVEEGHSLTDNWFFKMIEGKLLERFE